MKFVVMDRLNYFEIVRNARQRESEFMLRENYPTYLNAFRARSKRAIREIRLEVLKQYDEWASRFVDKVTGMVVKIED